ncbi:phosphopantetheine-binding protein [Streptomyces sp. NPDC056296]|uniref:AMP-binding enzyme n=1 Tax=Streptomyces sp. NPDC056296 TaxID=3345775 RepID=UPI0035D6DACE
MGRHAREGTGRGLTAGPGTGAEELRRFAAGALPTYAVPAHVFVLDELPRTRNGKVRKERLPSLRDVVPSDGAARVGVEAGLVRAVSQVLGEPTVDRSRSLLELGATSLHILRVCFALAEETGADFDVNLLFLGDSLVQIARDISAATTDRDAQAGT